MEKQNAVHPYNGMILSNQREYLCLDTQSHLAPQSRFYWCAQLVWILRAKWKKLVSKVTYCVIPAHDFLTKTKTNWEITDQCLQEINSGASDWLQRDNKRDPLEVMGLFYILIMVVFIWICLKFIKLYPIIKSISLCVNLKSNVILCTSEVMLSFYYE